MDDSEAAIFLERLIERRRALLSEGDVALEPSRRDDAAKVDEDEQPYTEMNQVIASRRNKARAAELQGIETAIARLRDDPEDFGFCEGCDEPIPTGRLEIMPWALFCVKCQARRDGDIRGWRRSHVGDYAD